MYDDTTLWNGMRKGDREMFLALYRKYYHSLLFIGLKEIRDAHLVKDVIQQQFLYLWEKRETIAEAKDVRAYLISTFLRKLSADWRKSSKTGNLMIAWSNLDAQQVPSPEETLILNSERKELYNVLMERVNALPVRQKELIVMRFYEGLSYEEIVQRTGLTYRTVYNKVHEAVKKLRMGLDKEESSYRAILSALLLLLSVADK